MRSHEKFDLNIVLPVYNEERELAKSVHTLADFLSEHVKDLSWHITIVDNASSDTTLMIARRLSSQNTKIRTVHLDAKGRGRAVKHAWRKGGYKYYAYMDIDLSTDLKHLPVLVHALRRGYDIGIGSRNARGSRVYGRSLIRTITSKTYIILIKIFFFVNFSDAQCGFKVVSKKVISELLPYVKDNDWFFDTELLILGEKSGLRIYEEPVTWIDNPGSTVRVLKTAMGDLKGLWRLLVTKPWKSIHYAGH